MENMQEETGIKLIFNVLALDDHVLHVICREYTGYTRRMLYHQPGIGIQVYYGNIIP